MNRIIAILALLLSSYAFANPIYCPQRIVCNSEGCSPASAHFSGSASCGIYDFYVANIEIGSTAKVTCTYRGLDGQELILTSLKTLAPDLTIPWNQWSIKGTAYNCQYNALVCPLKG